MEISGSASLLRNYRVEEVASPYAWQPGPTTRLGVLLDAPSRCIRSETESGSLRAGQIRTGPWRAAVSVYAKRRDLHEQAGSRNIVHMHSQLFMSRCDSCDHSPFEDRNVYELPAKRVSCFLDYSIST
jgi:NAD-dependent deacetylase